MFRHQEVTEFLSREWQSISAAPITFIIAVLGMSAITGLLIGLVFWKLQGRSARSKIGQLRELKMAEDDVLDRGRAKHDLEVDARKEIEAELVQVQDFVRRLHDSDLSSDQLIVDSVGATARAVETLKRSQDEFVAQTHGWDRLRASMHDNASRRH